MTYTLPKGEYMRRLLRARVFLINAETAAFDRVREAQNGVHLARQQLIDIDQQIASLNCGGAA